MAKVTPPLTLANGTLSDFSMAITTSGSILERAARNALDLLYMSGHACAAGDTADDLRVALAMHVHLLQEFSVRVRTAECTCAYNTRSASSFDAYAAAADCQGDTPCSISVTPCEPARDALERAHRLLGIKGTLNDALKIPALAITIRRVALKPHYIPAAVLAKSARARRQTQAVDLKKLAANDH